MILFEEDFKIQGATVDYKTKNKSAIKMAILLGRMGHKNNKFILALIQPELAGVDPFDPNLSSIIKEKIAIECKLNIWYFLRECVRVPSQGSDASPFIFDRANIGLTWLFANSITPFLTIPRQVGKTISTICIMIWVVYIGGRNLATALFAKDNGLVLENVERLKLIRDGLPDYLIISDVSDTNNKEGIGYSALSNKYNTYTAQPSKVRAMGQGRGPSICMEHWDEFAYYINNVFSYPSATSAITAAQAQVKATGMPCTNIITTTAGRLSEDSGMYAFNIKNNCMRFSEKLYDSINREELVSIIKANSNNNMCYLEYSYKQLGKTDAWFEEVIIDKTEDVIACDYLNIWQHTSTKSAISKDLSDLLLEHQREPVKCTVHNTLVVRWFVDPDTINGPRDINKPFIIGADTSDNVGVDFTTFVMIDPTTMQVVCTCKCNLANFVHVSKCIMEFLTKYPNSIIIPERNKNGKVLLDILILELQKLGFNPLRKIYNSYFQNWDGKSEVIRTIGDVTGDIVKMFGFWTGAASRDGLYTTTMSQTLKNNYDKISDPDLIGELRGLVTKNGRIDHIDGGHDDLTIAYLLACHFILHGKHIHLYGVDHECFLSEVTYKGIKVDPTQKSRQLEIQKRLKHLRAQRDACNSNVLIKTYDYEIKSLEHLIDTSIVDTDTLSMDQVMQQSKKVKEEFNVYNGTDRALQLFRTIYK